MSSEQLAPVAATHGDLPPTDAAVPKASAPTERQQHNQKPRPLRARDLDTTGRKQILQAAMSTEDMDNEHLLHRIRERQRRAGVQTPSIEVAFQNLAVQTEAFPSSRARPSIFNTYRNFIESGLQTVRLMKRGSRPLHILKGISGVLQPGRLALLLGPPSSGKSTLLKALAGNLSSGKLQVLGDIAYNGFPLSAFEPSQTVALVQQTDLHTPELTVRETLDHAARCQHTGYDELAELLEKERQLGIEPDEDIQAFMAVCSLQGKRHSLATDYMLRMLGLEICADVIAGSALARGISGGQRKRLTAGEMLVANKLVMLLDEISTGLDSSTTFQICRCIQKMAHLRNATVLVSLLQPPPETFNLFDDVFLLAEGQMVYQGPKEEVLPFFAALGFRPPPRQGTADFLQEVVSPRDQQQYWTGQADEYHYVPVSEMAKSFAAYAEAAPWHKVASSKPGDDRALVQRRFGQPALTSFKACMRREIILMQRNRFVYVFRAFQIAVTTFAAATLFIKPRMDTSSLQGGRLYLNFTFFGTYFMLVNGFSELAIATATLPVFFKQRDSRFYPVAAFTLPTTLLRLPFSLSMAVPWAVIVYWSVGLAPSAGRFFIYLIVNVLAHIASVTLFRATAALGRQVVLANIISFVAIALSLLFTGFIIPQRDIPGWYIWWFWGGNLFSYSQRALVVNEFTAPRWQAPFQGPAAITGGSEQAQTLGQAVLKMASFPEATWWPGLGIAVMVFAIIILNGIIIVAMTFLPASTGRKAVVADGAEDVLPPEDLSSKSKTAAAPVQQQHAAENGHAKSAAAQDASHHSRDSHASSRGMPASFKFQDQADDVMALPFEPIVLAFRDVNYYVPAPPGSALAKDNKELQLLHGITGCFRPGVMTALMGATGAGKTTLMDVLACRKNSGRTEATVRVNGFPQDARTFTRSTGYVEQADLHSPQTTVAEALWFSSRLRLPPSVKHSAVLKFNQRVMELVELEPLKDAIVGLPGVSGLSVEARKRLTIAVELVANPSLTFMDEPTSGLDARAAAIVMRAIKNINDTGRTIAVTVHQPSTLVFETFDELLLLKPGGRTIYVGPLGRESCSLIAYFEAIPGVARLSEGINPSTWMLEISTVSAEARLETDLATAFLRSQQCRQNAEHVERRLEPREGQKPLHHPTRYAQPLLAQYGIILHKFQVSYWRNPNYNASRLLFTIMMGVLYGSAFWKAGQGRASQDGVLRIAASVFLATVLLGFTNAATVQPVVSTERPVFYRERYAGLYASIPYAVAQGTVEIPYLLIQSALFTVIVYFMLHLETDAAKFFWFYLFQLLTLSYYTSYGIMCVALSSSLQIAAVISTTAYAMWVLFAGFLMSSQEVKQRAPWWIWANYLSPTFWTLWGMVSSQLGNVQEESLVDSDGASVSVASFVQQYFGFEHSMLGWVVLILAAFIVFFRFAAIWGLCYLNFQKR